MRFISQIFQMYFLKPHKLFQGYEMFIEILITRDKLLIEMDNLVQIMKLKLLKTARYIHKYLQYFWNWESFYNVTYSHIIGFVGLSSEIRHIIEEVFRQGHLPVLVSTSSLAMGVNLPAHLIIIKSTKTYENCEFRDYTEIAIQQMIGRAGRPQFDTSATAVILTTNQDKVSVTITQM